MSSNGDEDVLFESATLDDRGRVTIPKPLREQLELNDGDEIYFRAEEGQITALITGIDPAEAFEAVSERALQQHREGNSVAVTDADEQTGDDEH